MKKRRLNIIFAWALLFSFIAGQYVIYTHQHRIIASITAKAKDQNNGTSRSTIQEKCSVCDAMHHINAVIEHYHYFRPNIVTKHFYKSYHYAFVSIALILAAGRAPPVAAAC
ncbi:hypothetical protein ACFS5N_12325 [Mucilaginibacter ximonensis]|uniref:DUF2946 domain-containing protein n=1 Tax=Mucilaginibacter ximonensis TaxID=538021 RepID=A0ABW5YDC4_9SPHI